MKYLGFFLIVSLLSGPTLAKEPMRLLIIGDSLTAGYGVARQAAYPAQLEILLNADDQLPKLKVIGAGISGSTSSSLKKRLAWQLKKRPDWLMIALGANDGLRGLSPENMRSNLKAAIDKAKGLGIQVVLAGMKMPLNYGKKYREKFEAVFVELGKQKSVHFLPFLLEGVAGNKDLNLADGIHPNEKGHKVMAKMLFDFFKPKILRASEAKKEKNVISK